MAGLLCEEEVLEVDNVKYCGYCKYHFSKMVRFTCQRARGSVSHGLEGVGPGPGWWLVPGAGRTDREGSVFLPLRSSPADEG